MTTKSVAIIGGGFTGLVAALRLAQKGKQVTLIESGSELGGLAACFELEGVPIEKAYHHLFRTDTSIIALINELGIGKLLQWHASSVAIYRDGRMRSFMSPLDLLRFGACSFTGRIRTGFVALFLKKSKNWSPLARVTAMKWMRRYCGASATDAIWAPLLHGKFADHADKVSMAWLWARLHVRSNSREPGEGEKLGYIDGGFIRIIKVLECQLLERGVTIHTSTRISRIGHDGTKPTLTIAGQEVTYDAVLFTGSSRTFSQLLPAESGLDEYREKLQSIHYLGATCLVFTSEQDLGTHYWVNINDDDVPFLVFIQHTNLVPKSHYNGKSVYYIAGYFPHDSAPFTCSEDTLVSEWFQQLKKIYPAFDPELALETHLFRFKDAQHIAEVGYEAKIPRYETPLPGVFLSNFSQIFPEDRGTNFAVREGESISRIISAHLE